MGGGWLDALGGGWFDAMGGGWVDTAGGGGGGVHTFAMRADRPMAAHPIPSNFYVINSGFPAHYWDSDLFALTFLPDFFSANVGGQTWQDAITVDPPPPVIQKKPGVGDSIEELLTLAVTERPEAMGEIMNQNQNQQLCFLQLLMINHNSHPATYFAMKLVARVGEVVMMRLKRHWNRARPSQVCPTLYPPVPVPGHASYPAGHAIIAHLTAKCLIDVTQDKNTGVSPYADALALLAEEIGRNRVIAGLHYFSDIEAGGVAADKTYAFLTSIPDPNPLPDPPYFNYRMAVEAAQKEWP
jgi:hypothetical protein